MKLMQNPAVANVVKSTVAFAVLIAVWQVVGQLTHAPEHIVPLPSKIGEVFVRTFWSQVHHLGATGFATVCGLALALVVGVLLAIAVVCLGGLLRAAGRHPKTAQTIQPDRTITEGLQDTPRALTRT